MIFSKWRDKDNWDQPAHALVGALITLVPTLILKYLFSIDSFIVLSLVLFLSYAISITIGVFREYLQHQRFVYNLDIFFWVLGATILGAPIGWIVILLL